MESPRPAGGLLADVRDRLRRTVVEIARDRLSLELEPEAVVWETPPDTKYGDLASPLAMRLAKTLRRAPIAIAEELRQGLAAASLPLVAAVTVSPPGFLNVRLDESALMRAVLAEVLAGGVDYGQAPPLHRKVVVEHTNMNPNKAAHIGHVRNACLGDSLVRILRRCGYEVEVQNYIDDTGAQVADVVLGIQHLGLTLAAERPFDHACWDLYSEVHRRYEAQPELREVQREYLHRIESGEGETANFAKEVAERVLAGHLRTMWGLGINYDVLTWESDIVRKGFWRHAFATLRAQGSLIHETEGPNAGCWVVRLRGIEDFAGLENPDKVIVRSNGTATYVAKDIAYQLWKFGVLGLDFDYRLYGEQPGCLPLYSSCPPAEAQPLPAGLAFGRADRVINVIDIRQKYLQDILRHSLRQLGYATEADNSVHFGYEVVALSPETAAELGIDISGEVKGAYAMAGRKGLGVKADDLIEAAAAKATAEVERRHPEMTAGEVAALAHDIAVGAVRYYMVRFHTNTLIVFDSTEALAMNGHTGPYLQYAHARALSILRRATAALPGCPADHAGALAWSLAWTGGSPAAATSAAASGSPAAATSAAASGSPAAATSASDPAADEAAILPAEKALALTMAEFSAKLQAAAAEMLPSILADYAYGLATAFTDFYESAPVLSAPPAIQARRVSLVAAFVQVMRNVLDTLGLPAPGVL